MSRYARTVIDSQAGPSITSLALSGSLTLSAAQAKRSQFKRAVAGALTLSAALKKKVKVAHALTLTMTRSFVARPTKRVSRAASFVFTGGMLGRSTGWDDLAAAASGYIAGNKVVVSGHGRHISALTSRHSGRGTVKWGESGAKWGESGAKWGAVLPIHVTKWGEGGAKWGEVGAKWGAAVTSPAPYASLRPVIYADNAGTVQGGALVAVGPEAFVSVTSPLQEFVIPFSDTVFLSAGSYWIGWWLGPQCDEIDFYFMGGPSGSENYAAVAYDSTASPPTTFPSASATTKLYMLHADMSMLDESKKARLAVPRSLTLSVVMTRVRTAHRALAPSLVLTALSTRISTRRRTFAVNLTATSAVVKKVRIVYARVLTFTATRASTPRHRFTMAPSISFARTFANSMIKHRAFAATMTFTRQHLVSIVRAKTISSGLTLGTTLAARAKKIRLLAAPLTSSLILALRDQRVTQLDIDLALDATTHKAIRLRIPNILLQTNPRLLSALASRRLLFAAPISFVAAVARKSSRFRTVSAALTIGAVRLVRAKMHRTFAAPLMVTGGHGVDKTNKRALSASTGLTVAWSKLLRKKLAHTLSLGPLSKVRPATFKSTGVGGLLSADEPEAQLLSVTRVSGSPDD